MRKLHTYILYGIILLGCFSCKKEDDLIPNAPQPNLFAPAEGATDPTSQLRRKFYEETGVYLLFTDTLKNEYYGTDVYGNSVVYYRIVGLVVWHKQLRPMEIWIRIFIGLRETAISG